MRGGIDTAFSKRRTVSSRSPTLSFCLAAGRYSTLPPQGAEAHGDSTHRHKDGRAQLDDGLILVAGQTHDVRPAADVIVALEHGHVEIDAGVSMPVAQYAREEGGRRSSGASACSPQKRRQLDCQSQT